MAYYYELTTVVDLRSTYLVIVGTSDDALQLALIRSVSSDIVKAAGRQFVPRVETRRYNPQRSAQNGLLVLDDDLLSVTTLTNGDATTIASTKYKFETPNTTPYWGIKLLSSSGLTWTYDEDPEEAISLVGIWGCDLGWQPNKSEWVTADTLGAAISTTTATSITLTVAGSLEAGWLLKIDSEYLYVSGAPVSTTATVVRGVNGSTAATHSNGATISYWRVEDGLEQLAKECAAARYRLRNNPLAETFVAVDGTVFTTPKDVKAYIEKSMLAMGLVRG